VGEIFLSPAGKRSKIRDTANSKGYRAMSKLKSMFSGIPLLQNVRSVVALVLLTISLVVLLVFGIALILMLPTYSKLVADLELSQVALEQAKQLQKESPPKLRSEIAVAQALLEEAASVFPTDQQAMSQLDDVYRYASEAGVYIAKLEKLVNTPEEEAETTYTTRRAFLEATGDLRQLTTFIRLLTQVALPTFNLDSLKISPAAGWQHVLTANVVVRSSALSSGVAPRSKPDGTSPPAGAAELRAQLDQAWQAEDWSRAIDILLEVRQVDPEDQNAQGMLYCAYVSNGYALLDAGKRDEAITQFNNALRINPDGTEATQGLTEALETGMLEYVSMS